MSRIEDNNTISKADVKRTYDFYAPLYDFVFGAMFKPGRRELASEIARLSRTPSRLLEVGVGTGLTLHLYPQETALTGVDISDDMLARARMRAALLPGRSIELLCIDGEALPFPDGHFDCVALPYVLSVTSSPEKLVREVRRVCAPHGHIFVLNHFSGSRFWGIFERLVAPFAARIGFRSAFMFDENILRYDWQVLSVRPVNLLGLSRLVRLRNR